MLTLDTVAWHAMVIGHVKCGKGQKVIGTILLAKCNRKGVETESVTFLEALYAFTNLVTRSKEPYMFMSTLFKLVLNVTCLCIIGSLSCMSNCGRVKDGWIW
jgi:hypothetical protein